MSAENACEMKKIYLYTRFERFWHWMQAALILGLLITGLEIHGSYTWLGFKTAVEVHNFCAWTWIVLYAFVLFWMATTGEWKQYIPTTKRLFDVAFITPSASSKASPTRFPRANGPSTTPCKG